MTGERKSERCEGARKVNWSRTENVKRTGLNGQSLKERTEQSEKEGKEKRESKGPRNANWRRTRES